MAASHRISVLTDELISITAGASPNKDPARFKKLKSLVEKILKNDKSMRTDQFEVARRLDGLQEKFQVLDNDELADALHLRLEELSTRRCHWAPEALSLFLELSDKPATLSRPENVELLRPYEPRPTLTWADIDASDPPDEQEDIWNDIDYAADSSDDDLSFTASDVSIPRIIPQSSKVPLNEFKPSDDLFINVEDEDMVLSIRDSHIKRHDIGVDSITFITELQAIRDVVFMLQGLPSTIFRKFDKTIAVNPNFALRHTSREAFESLLESFSRVGFAVYILRMYVKQPQLVPFMQTFQRELESLISEFDTYLSQEQAHCSFQAGPISISLIQLLDNVQRKTKILLQLADLVERLDGNSSNENFQCLDLLYDLVCAKQAASEDEEFREIAKVFFKCFESYAKPIQLWMKTGELGPTLASAFFVTNVGKSTDLKTLWHEWFTFQERYGQLYAPKFLHPSSRKIFTTGKSMIFLRHLGLIPENLNSMVVPASLSYEDLFSGDQNSLLLPFSGQLEAAFDRFVDANHSIASSLLRSQLGDKCGLWAALEALEYIYLSRDYGRSASTDHRIFELIDRGSQSWNDRFLITDLLRQSFGSLPCIDATRLIARSTTVSPGDFVNHGRSVKILKALSIDYKLPWPVANIIAKGAAVKYQRISIFLMQIRRAKYSLENCWFAKPFRNEDSTLSFGIRHRLIWFLNVLYNHFTQVVIFPLIRGMVTAMARSKDVDSMIEVHRSHITSLEERCLLSKHLAPVHQTVISLLDLSIKFIDIQTARHAEHEFRRGDDPFGPSSSPRFGSRSRRSSLENRGFGSNTEDELSDIDDIMFNNGNATAISFIEKSYKEQLLEIRTKFDEMCDFIKIGLRGVGHGDSQQTFEILADNLDWKKDRFRHVS